MAIPVLLKMRFGQGNFYSLGVYTNYASQRSRNYFYFLCLVYGHYGKLKNPPDSFSDYLVFGVPRIITIKPIYLLPPFHVHRSAGTAFPGI